MSNIAKLISFVFILVLSFSITQKQFNDQTNEQFLPTEQNDVEVLSDSDSNLKNSQKNRANKNIVTQTNERDMVQFSSLKSPRILSNQNQNCGIANCQECQKNYFMVFCKRCASLLFWNPLSNKCQQISQNFQTISPCNQISNCQTCIKYTLQNADSYFCVKCTADVGGKKNVLPTNGKCLPMDSNPQNQNQNNESQNQKSYDFDKRNKEGKNKYFGDKYIKCIVGCKACNSTADFTSCSTCLTGFALDTVTSTCSKCSDLCLTCDSSNTQSCTSCYPGNVLKQSSESKTCQKCSDTHCAVCTSSEAGSCTTCKNFYFLNQTKNCQSCPNNCRICSDQSKCSVCLQGYFLQTVDSSNTKCSACIDGCASCSNYTTCNKCYPGFFYNSQNKCQKCSANCWKCTSTSSCSQCILGTRLVDSACVTQIQNCAKMNKDNTCSQCFFGFTLNTEKSKCTRVDSSTVNPQNFNPFNCKIGQYLKNFVCTACGSNISNCQHCNADGCIKCQKNYYYNPSGKVCTLCSSTIIGCDRCQNSLFCTSCSNGYYMEQDIVNEGIISYGKCLKCSDNCKTCNTKQNLCTSCNTGLYLTTSRTCISQNQFNFTITLIYDLTLLSASKMDDIKGAIARTIVDNSLTLEAKKKCILIKSAITPPKVSSILDEFIRNLQAVKYTEISGTIAVSSSSNAQQSQTNFQNSIVYGSTVGNIFVVSTSSSTPFNANSIPTEDTKNTNTNTSSSKSNTGAIVGGIIGGILGAIVIGIIVYCVCIKKKNSGDDKKSTYSLNSAQIITQANPNQANNNPQNYNYFNSNKQLRQGAPHTNNPMYNPQNVI